MLKKGVDIQLVIKLYKSGLSLQECCDRVGLKSSGSLLKRLRKHGVKLRAPTESRKAKLDKDHIINLYHKGLSCQDIANENGNTSQRTIYKYLKFWGIELRTMQDAAVLASGSFLSPENRQHIINLFYEKKLSRKVISERTEISYAVVRQFLYLQKKQQLRSCPNDDQESMRNHLRASIALMKAGGCQNSK